MWMGVEIMLNEALLQRTAVNFNTTGDNTIVAAVAGKTIQVYGLVLVVTTTAVALTIKDGATALTGPMTVLAGTPLVLGLPIGADSAPLFATSSVANAFVIGQGAGASQVSGICYFVQG